MDEHKGLSAQNASVSSVSATPNVSLGSLQTDLTESCGMNENFTLINDIGLDVTRPCVDLNYREHATRMNSKLSLSYHGKLYGKIEITGRRPMDILKPEESESWRAFKSEIRFIATHFCHWHSHPNLIRYHGLALLKEEGGCVPYLLSERIEWNLLSLLEDRNAKLSQQDKISIIHDIASGVSFLHSRRPRPIVHAALDAGSILIDKRGNAKLTNFFHAGYVGDPFTIVSESHKPKKNNIEMKLETSLDMSSLGYIIKAIDTEHKNRECVRGSRNVLAKFYVLYDSENGPPQDLTACEVCRRLAAYLDQNPQQQLSVNFETPISVCTRGWVYGV